MRSFASAIVLCCSLLSLTTGCFGSKAAQEIDSFLQCPACQRCHGEDKHPMILPRRGEFDLQPSPAGSIESVPPVNRDALEEVKRQAPGGYCPDGNCPYARRPLSVILPELQGRAYRPSNSYGIPLAPGERLVPGSVRVIVKPSNQTLPATPAKPATNSQTKGGAYACQKCGHPTVGEDWHQTWTPGGASALFMCERCWETSSPAQRRLIFEKYAEKTGISGALKEDFKGALN